MPELMHLSIVQAAEAIAARELSPVELVAAVLDRAEQLDPEIGAFVTQVGDDARLEARRLAEEAAAGRLRGPLHGIPFGIKDLIDTAGIRTTSSSRVRADHVPETDAPLVSRLKAAGAIVVGKTNTHEFAYGPVTAPTRNAWDLDRIPGGSSGGSGAAVAAGMCTAAIGTDTGGSIRIPAAFNGIVGLKPTYGRVPKSGITTLSWTLDHAGPMTRTVADAAIVLNVIAGRDRSDPTSAREPVDDYTSQLAAGVSGLRLGVPRNYFREVIEPEVLELVDAAGSHLETLGAELVEVTIADVELSVPAELGILLPDASAYHQRDLRQSADLYGIDVRTFLELGELYLATHYVNAQRVRTLVKEGMRRCFEEARLDALLVPPVPMLPPRIGHETIIYPDAGEQSVIGTLFRTCSPFNLSGQPILTVPCGFSSEGLPVGLGIAGRPFDEVTVLRIANAYERSTDWHTRRPTYSSARTSSVPATSA
jgi:aspartyl-tRNA(Asn)/glutamyl-tRNA(Gln) amidotransferase subunit A